MTQRTGGAGAGPDVSEVEFPDAPPGGFPEDAWDLVAPMLTPERRARFVAVAAARTHRLRLVVQDVYNPHNVSACLRSAEAFGIQCVDVVTQREKFKASMAARGVANWLTLKRYASVADCAGALRAAGFGIYAAVPSPKAVSLAQIPVDRKVAVVFGNEHHGVDLTWHAHIDEAFTIPMVGMVESLNISVSVGICLQQLTAASRLASSAGEGYHLSASSQRQLLNCWACRHLGQWQRILPRLRQGIATT